MKSRTGKEPGGIQYWVADGDFIKSSSQGSENTKHKTNPKNKSWQNFASICGIVYSRFHCSFIFLQRKTFTSLEIPSILTCGLLYRNQFSAFLKACDFWMTTPPPFSALNLLTVSILQASPCVCASCELTLLCGFFCLFFNFLLLYK